MQIHLSWMHNFFLPLTFNVSLLLFSLKRLKWSLQFNIHLSNYCLSIGAKQLIVDVEDGVVQSFKASEVGSTFGFNKCLDRLDLVDIKSPPPTNYGGCQIRARTTLSGNFWTQPKIAARPAQLRKKTSPLHSWRPLDYKSHIECTSPYGLKSNMYVHFHVVNKSLIGISFWKWNHQPRT